MLLPIVGARSRTGHATCSCTQLLQHHSYQACASLTFSSRCMRQHTCCDLLLLHNMQLTLGSRHHPSWSLRRIVQPSISPRACRLQACLWRSVYQRLHLKTQPASHPTHRIGRPESLAIHPCRAPHPAAMRRSREASGKLRLPSSWRICAANIWAMRCRCTWGSTLTMAHSPSSTRSPTYQLCRYPSAFGWCRLMCRNECLPAIQIDDCICKMRCL